MYSAVPTPMLLEGERLGEFEILARLGEGAMGAVYKARQTVLKRLVAIKTLQPSLSSDEEFVTRFHNEAIAAAGLNHPNLVQVYAAGESNGVHWFAMEFVDGESVQTRLKRQGKLDPAEALAICMHIQTALAYGWRKAKLIHRDIKPDNIFLSNDGEVKLGDLGLAKSSDHQQSLTMTGASMGTPLYISPEQAEGKRDIDLRTDIYSLGATLYHLLAGTPPYTGESFVSLIMKHVSAPVPDIREIEPTLPAALSAVLMKCMQKAPSDRYSSYEELGADLSCAYAALSEPVSAAPQEPTGASVDASQGHKTKRHPAVLISAIAVPLLAVGATFLFGTRKNDPVPAQSQTTVSPEEKTPPAPPVPASATAPISPASEPKAQPDTTALPELVKKLEAKLLPVPGKDVLMSKTELTVGEWKLYLRAEGLPPWEHPKLELEKENPSPDRDRVLLDFKTLEPSDEHPQITSWEEAKKMCDWLSSQTGSTWRMPTDAEWESAVGVSKFPWGDSYPPRWDDGNYSVLANGERDPERVGVDGIRGPAPVASFKPNALGYYDLGGNVTEWMAEGIDRRGYRQTRGGGAFSPASPEWLATSARHHHDPKSIIGAAGLRIVRVKTAEERAASSPVTASSSPNTPEPSSPPPPPSPPPSDPASNPEPLAAPQAPPPKDKPNPPKGFRALFDGVTLSGWHGLNPHEVARAPLAQQAALVQKQRADFPRYWRVENGDLINTGAGPFATTAESFGNIELFIEYKASPGADSGIYLRGTPQIQIWDTSQKDTADRRPSLGSGGLYNNASGSPGKNPLVHADNPIGQWNQFGIRQIGAITWVWLNNQLVVDGAIWEPFWEKNKPLPEKAPILLQTHSGEIRWRNIFVRDIPDAEAREHLKVWNIAQAKKKTAPAPANLVQRLVQQLESKLLPIPGTNVRMTKTEITVGEWKVYLQEAHLPPWSQPDKEWIQTDEHPVVMVDHTMARDFCSWLSSKTGQQWSLPSVKEWEAAVGKLKYPWGDYGPPKKEDGNFCFLEDGKYDPNLRGVDGIKGTSPVGSFKPNALGFYDLGGNAMEWMRDQNTKDGTFALRGGGWRDQQRHVEVDSGLFDRSHQSNNIGFRVVRKN